MQLFTTVPIGKLGRAGDVFAELEGAGYDGAFTFETAHDPFLPLVLGATRTSTLRLGTAIAIAFARTPMTVANTARDLQELSGGRFTLGLGSQIRPHVTRRYSMPWSRPAARMREFVLALRAIWDSWDGTAPLDFRGEFYTHTLMPPAFNPGPFTNGRPRVHVAGVGPHMVRVAGEVADGLITHPFATRQSLEQQVLPALGPKRGGFEVVVVCFIVTEPDLDEGIAAARGQLSFYGSTPAYAPVLDLLGHGDLHRKLNALSKEGRWSDMAELIPDDVLESIAIVGQRDEIPGLVAERVRGIADAVSIECTRRPDPEYFADIVTNIRSIL